MNIRVQMIDADNGEILATKYANYALNFATKNDNGFVFLMKWIQSAVRGVRIAHHKSIELRIGFVEEKEELFIPFGMTQEEVTKNAAQYVY